MLHQLEAAVLHRLGHVLGADLVAAGKKIEETGQKISSAGQTMTRYVTAPIVGGAAAAVKAGADIIVTGTFVEQEADESKIKSVIDAVKKA